MSSRKLGSGSGSINDGEQLGNMEGDQRVFGDIDENDIDVVVDDEGSHPSFRAPPLVAAVWPLVKKLISEFWGTFFLVTTIGLAAGQGAPLAALSIGAALWAAIFAFGHVSGAHFNPAITLGVYMRGRIPIIDGALYIIFQLLGAFGGAAFSNEDLLVSPTKGYECLVTSNASQTNLCGAGFPNIDHDYRDSLDVPFSMELLWTFFLVTVVLNCATVKKNSGNSFYGFAIGSVVMCGAVSCGGISGGAFNPAVGTALPVIAGAPEYVWLYWLAPMVGGAMAAVVFAITADWQDDFKGEVHQCCVLWSGSKKGCLCSAKKL